MGTVMEPLALGAFRRVDHIGETVHADRLVRAVQFAGAATRAKLGNDPIDHDPFSDACVRGSPRAGAATCSACRSILGASRRFHNLSASSGVLSAWRAGPRPLARYAITKRYIVERMTPSSQATASTSTIVSLLSPCRFSKPRIASSRRQPSSLRRRASPSSGTSSSPVIATRRFGQNVGQPNSHIKWLRQTIFSS